MLFLSYFLETGSENLHISHILQKAKIEVSEDGTKASAVTSKRGAAAGLALGLDLGRGVSSPPTSSQALW